MYLNFIIVSVLMQTFLLWHHTDRTGLPLIKNKLFRRISSFSIASGLMNLTACLLSAAPCKNVFLIYLINILYFFGYVICTWVMFEYGMYYVGDYERLNKYKPMFFIPVVATLVIIVLTPVFPLVFQVAECGEYSKGEFRWLINMPIVIYSLIALISVSNNAIKKDRNELICILLALAVVNMGAFLNEIEPAEMLMEPFTTFAVLILYITIENPNFYKSSVCGAYNRNGYDALIHEFENTNTPFNCFGITITNMDSCTSYYSMDNLKAALQQASEWLSQTYPDCYIFFLNNDSFMFITTENIDESAINSTLYSRFEEPFGMKGIKMYFHTSLFIVENPHMFSDPSKIASAVHLIKHQVITRCDNGIYYINQDAIDLLEKEINLQELVDQAAANDSFDVYLQPIVSSKTNKVVGAEVLCRLIDDELGYIPPSDFIPLAERSGAIMVIGLQVFERVCEYVSTRDVRGMGIEFINVNISPVQYQDRLLVEKYYAIALKYGVDFTLFDFEITETLDDESLVFEDQLDRLIAKGASVSLDDFGMGASNIQRLLRCPISVAKLDISLVWDYFSGKSYIMEHIINMFRGESLSIVAEGVETKQMVDTLSTMGCDYLQGFYFSKALPFDSFDKFVSKFNN